MIQELRSPFIAACLAALLLLLGGVLSAQAVGHVSQHTHHHTSATHASTLCSWYCAAGQVHSSDLVVVATPIVLFLGVEIEEPSSFTTILIIPSPSRAPPAV